MGEPALSVNLVLDKKVMSISYSATTTAEDVCTTVCKKLSIGPVARHLFALRVKDKQIFLMPSATFTEKNPSYDLRIRFKPASLDKLKKIDINAYNYYFHQARNDLLENKIPDIVFDKCRRELVGLGVTDMYRVMLEKDITKEIVENDYRKYMPKEVIKRHSFFVKKPVKDTLEKIRRSGHDAWYVKSEYLKQLDNIAPEYLCEEYKALNDRDGSIYSVFVRVSPYHPTDPGIRICLESRKDQWEQICKIEDLCHISIRKDGTVEISRKNGIPFYLQFALPLMYSFVSLLDGYYRLTCKWTFNLCKDVTTPSLKSLYSMRCHGPVGGEFSYSKLEEKRGNHPGCFILRECETRYNVYFIDVCIKNCSKPKTYKLEKLPNNELIFNDDLTKYKNVFQLIKAYSDPNGSIFLQECLPPSEYDNSHLLLCQNETLVGDSLTDGSSVKGLIPSSPLCINNRDIQVYKGHKKLGSEERTMVYRSMWKLTKGKKIEVAMKILKHEYYEEYLKEFLELAGQWAFLQSYAIVKLFGVTLTSPVSMVLEYMKLGNLDQYLQRNKSSLKEVDLIEAATNLASALWHLEENGIVHGKIRCKKLLVSYHDDRVFTVKLSDPGVRYSYSSNEVHWIPVECYSNLEFAKRSTAADVWAFATTLWEIFMYGEQIKQTSHINAMKFYASGKRLPQPASCPNDIYQIMKECWDADPHRRKQPQAIMRDIKQIFYQVFNSRRVHSYAKVFTSKMSKSSGSVSSLNTNATDSTYVLPNDGLVSLSSMSEKDIDFMYGSSTNGISVEKAWILGNLDYSDDTESCDVSTILSNFDFSAATSATSLNSLNSMQSVFELDGDCNVVLQGRIGQGFYGEVYKGTLEYLGDKDIEAKQVAVKKLKTSAVSTCLQDFEREITIMKNLKHPNIVEIFGVLQEPEISLVMEYVPHGSLQSYLKIYKEVLTVKQLLKYALDIANGMEYLGTKHNIVHRDLAARNILVVDENHVKISDFGLAQVMGPNDYYILKTSRELPIKWYALESLRDGKFSSRSDVWSFGVTLCEMFSYGEEPKLPNVEVTPAEQEQQALLNSLENGARFPCPPMCPQSVYVRIIYPCWTNSPHDRPTFSLLHGEIQDMLTQY
ncbi:tyrosine-protein kinase hopscotch [Agrilus planipennis]|uniref:non-specific protein-tyrosine kinase n=1 Tax=Agrilus planipennis TaxID=224129 RepID=A0A1W4XLI2_AGRPL|nr:tyrosine-protein kinase hopscotch [Agrilus planipennis]